MSDAKRITKEELKTSMDAGEPLFIIDVRGESWKSSDTQIVGSHRISLDELADNYDKIPKDHLVVAYCT